MLSPLIINCFQLLYVLQHYKLKITNWNGFILLLDVIILSEISGEVI